MPDNEFDVSAAPLPDISLDASGEGKRTVLGLCLLPSFFSLSFIMYLLAPSRTPAKTLALEDEEPSSQALRAPSSWSTRYVCFACCI